MRNKTNFAGLLVALAVAANAGAKTQYDFKILKKQLDQSGIYSNKTFQTVKKCVQRNANFVDRESIGGVGLYTKVDQIEKITKCKLETADITKDDRGLTTWNFRACDFTVIFKDQYPLTLVIGGKSQLKLKSTVGIGSPIDLAKKKYRDFDLRENSRETVISTPNCEIPDVCTFDYPTLSLRGDTYAKVIIQAEINRYSAGYCAGR